MTAILEITDGTQGNTVDLLEGENGGFGYSLVRWPQSLAQPKGGGVYEDSPLTEGRQLTFKVLSNAIEKLSLKCRGSSQNNLIEYQRELIRILDLGVRYWLDADKISPIYIKAKASAESNIRYGVIVDYKTLQFPGTHEQPFIQPNCGSNAVFDNLDLAIERLSFFDNPPGQSEGVSISSAFSYDSRDLGVQTATSDEAVHIGNRHVEANLTHIYFFDDSAGTFGSNLMDATPPFTLIPSTTAPSDIVYFGIENVAGLKAVFGGLVFDFDAITVSTRTFVAEYWDGASWTTIIVNGDANKHLGPTSGNPAGVYSLHWYQPVDWSPTTINGVDAIWIRIRYISSLSVKVVTQANRLIYTPSTPYLDISSTEIGGDKDALAKLKYRNVGGGDSFIFGVISGNGLVGDDIIISSRSLSRGNDFSAYLNFSIVNNLNGISSVALPKTTIDSDSISPSGYRATYNPTVNVTNELAAQIDISGSGIPEQYIGSYKISLRLIRVGSVAVSDDSLKIRVEVSFPGTSALVSAGFVSTPFYVSESIEVLNATGSPPPESNLMGVVDFETPLTIPDIRSDTVTLSDISIKIYADVNYVTLPDVYFYDIVLIPIDEVTNIQVKNSNVLKTLFVSEEFLRLTVSSLDDFRFQTKGTITASPDIDITESVIDSYLVIGEKFLISNAKDVRLWFFCSRVNLAIKGTLNVSMISACHVPKLFKNQQYLSAIGNG